MNHDDKSEALFAGNPQMELAWSLIADTDTSVFLTGNAGTGKTTFLRKLQDLRPKRMVVVAPTGVAAINARGQTIHSFFQLPFGPMPSNDSRQRAFRMSKFKKKLMASLDLLVIDEISMVRADLLDAIDKELRRFKSSVRPFGGVQLLLIGDLQQLAPVAKEDEWELLRDTYASPYFFDSHALRMVNLVTVELSHIYRQQDATFIDILGKVRSGRLDRAAIEALNARYIPDFNMADGDNWIRLTTHNRTADDYNSQRLGKLSTESHLFKAQIEKNFPENSIPADMDLELKVGAQVMFLKNDTESHLYYNGKIGVVRGFDKESIVVWSKEDDREIHVSKAVWENTRYTLNIDTGEILEEVEGRFTQYPLRLAWAITVHKSQGLTFDHAVLDINASFAHGQAYVALSRCRTLEGLVLSAPIASRAIIHDSTVGNYVDQAKEQSAEVDSRLPQMRLDYHMRLLDELFDFSSLKISLAHLGRVVDEHLYKLMAPFSQVIAKAVDRMESEVVGIGLRFGNVYRSAAATGVDIMNDKAINERIANGLSYFRDKLKEILAPVYEYEVPKIGNKQTKEVFKNAFATLDENVAIKRKIMDTIIEKGFSARTYLDTKAVAEVKERKD